MIAFWVVAGLLSVIAAALVLSRAARAATRGAGADPTPDLYRRQLSEIDDLADRGLLADGERKAAHAEAGRRLLAADAAPALPWSADGAERRPVLIAAVAAPALALVLYFVLGSPAFPDQPFAARLASWKAADPQTLDAAQMAAVLTDLIREQPNDPEAYRFLAIARGASQDPPGAVRAARQAVALAPNRADLWEMLGQTQVFAAQGEATPEALDAFRRSFELDPKGVSARFYLAQAKVQAGDKAGGVADLAALKTDLAPDDPRREALDTVIAEAEGRAPPPAPVAPTQMAAIRGMVAGLAQRLETAPDDPEGWVRLVRAYGVLNEPAKRDAALAEAKRRYAARPEILKELDAAARAEPMS